MCLYHPRISDLGKWNWDGDRILFDAIVPSSRAPIGRRSLKEYDIDVRQFLVTEKNAVVKRVLRDELPVFCEKQGVARTLIETRGQYGFDLRAHQIAAFVAKRIRYENRKGRDPWQFPEETLALGSGDCEDIAFLLASLLLASGVSGYNVRVALGRISAGPRHARKQHFDHMWVMYKSEAGKWLLLEPLQLEDSGDAAPDRGNRGKAIHDVNAVVEYTPKFVFNTEHLWEVGPSDGTKGFAEQLARRWKKINPKFIGVVHRTILNEALRGLAPDWMIDGLNRNFTTIFGKVLDAADNVLTHGYNPLDHFDNGFIDEGWGRVNSRLAQFKQNNRDLDSFASAAHAIADFYAHSSYLHFADVRNGRASPYDSANPSAGLARPPSYASGTDFDLTSDRFTLNPRVFSGSKQQAAALWQDKIISGRYAQKRDSHDTFELITFIPKALTGAGFAVKGSLPHHNEIAVDSESIEDHHRLYRQVSSGPADRLAYDNQFRWRTQTAIEHIRQAFTDNQSAP